MHPIGGIISGKLLQSSAKTLLSLFHFTETLPLTQQLHAQIIVNGLYQSILFGSKLSNVYIELGYLQCATQTFHLIAAKNLNSWNSIISGFFKNKHFWEAIRLFKQMRTELRSVDTFNLVFAIKACVKLRLLQEGNLVHSLAIKSGLEGDSYVVPALIDVHSEMGSLKAAQKLFDEIPERNAVLWGTMMRVYLKFSEPIKVFELLFEMRTFGLELDAFTSECAIRACGNISADREGKSVHGFCTRQNFIDSNIYLQTSLIEMYLKCGLLDFGLRLFEGAKIKDVVLWTATIAGFAKNGRAWEAAALFRQMLEQSISPNPITLSSVLLACTHIGSLQQGKSLHGYMIRKEVEMDVVSYTSLIDMYAKCGLISEAYTVFRKMPTKNTFTWSAMISGFGINGLFDEAIEVFNQMRSENQIPNSITFVSVLSACSHSGRVEEGWNYLKLMSMDYGITAVEEHIACMVDLLGRAGKIDEALSFIRDMPMKPGASAWGALLSACRLHRRVEIVEEAAKKLLPLEPDKTAVYVLLSNVYGDAGMWENVNKIRLKVGENGFYKTAGFSSIEVDKKIRFFFSETRLARGYTQVEGVCISLQEIMKRLISYVPDNGSVHYDVGG